MTSLPNDIIHDEILHKLPAKSLVRFKCVSKSFNTLISSPEFIDLHLRLSLSSDANRLLILGGKRNSNLYSIDVDSPRDSAIQIPLPRTLNKWLGGNISIVGSFNGLLCVKLLLEMEVDEYKHVLINPSTGVYREITHLRSHRGDDVFFVTFGFGFDELNNDYKLVRVLEHYRDEYDVYDGPYEGIFMHNREVMVYSLNEDSWNSVEVVEHPLELMRRRQNGVLLKNYLLHWVFWDHQNYKIGVFDVRTDKWVDDVPLMDLITYRKTGYVKEDENEVFRVNLGVLHECLCLSTVNKINNNVWMMKEYGVKESWVKLFEIPHSFGHASNYDIDCPLGFRQGSKREILVQKKDSFELFWCNIESENHCRIEAINGVPSFEDTYLFKGSLVPIPGGHKILA